MQQPTPASAPPPAAPAAPSPSATIILPGGSIPLEGLPQTAAALSGDPRFEQLMVAVDAMAEEVERIGEGQRFVTQLLAERREEAPVLARP